MKKKDRKLSNLNIIRGVETSGSISEFARLKGIPRKTMSDWYRDALKATEDSTARTYVLTCAQIETDVHEGFLRNLEVYCREMNAELLVSGFTYNTSNLRAKGVKEDQWSYDKSIRGYLSNKRRELNSNVVWLGDMNTLPTATSPLSGFKTHTGSKSGVFPHPRISMESVATRQGHLAKTLMTTGCVTLPNYIQKKAGIKAEFHHSLGAVIVEVSDDQVFHLRHIHADSEGNFYDLTDKFEAGVHTTGHRIEAITCGDIHREKLDPVVAQATWGLGIDGYESEKYNILDTLKPKAQFFHDLSDFQPRNHHNRSNASWMFNEYHNGKYTVESALRECAEFLVDSSREFCKSYVVCSNHDTAFEKWLNEADYKEDPENALFFLECQPLRYGAMPQGRQLDIFGYVLGKFMSQINTETVLSPRVHFLGIDESCVIKGIEMGQHGHLGVNGSRNSKSLSQIGVKCNIAHAHSPSIVEGLYTAGVSGKLQMGYNLGPSGWSHAHILVYPNGQRTVLTLIQGKYTNRKITEAKV